MVIFTGGRYSKLKPSKKVQYLGRSRTVIAKIYKSEAKKNREIDLYSQKFHAIFFHF